MLRLTRQARDIFPGLEIHGIRFSGYGFAARLIQMDHLRKRVAAAAAEDREIVGTWRPVYGKMGLKPSKYLSSVEALTKRARKGENAWLTGEPSIDLYNAMSIIHGVPMGGYDLDKIDGREVTLRRARRETDRYTPVGGRIDMSKGGEDLLVYAAGDDLLCWGLNHRDSADFCLEPETSKALIMSEGTSPEQVTASRSALAELTELLIRAGAEAEWSEVTVPGAEQFPEIGGT